MTRVKEILSAYEPVLLYRLAIASFLSSALSRRQLESYKSFGLGQINIGYMQLLNRSVITNAVAASMQMCAAIVFTGLLLADRGRYRYG
jgi:hypothetical protein